MAQNRDKWHFEYVTEPSDSIKIKKKEEPLWLAKKLLTPEEGMCFMEAVSNSTHILRYIKK